MLPCFLSLPKRDSAPVLWVAIGLLVTCPLTLAAGDGPPGSLLLGWGDNEFGQAATPEGLENVIEIAAGAGHSLALRENGLVAAWGNNADGQCQIPETLAGVVAIAAGDRHSLAVLADGSVVGWGADESGQATPPADLANVVAVAAGGRHSLALRKNGTVVVWGANDFSQSTQPANVENVVAISASRDQCMVVFSDGRVRSWGRNDFNQSVQPDGLLQGVMGANGETHTMMLRRDGSIQSWGTDTAGQLAVPEGIGEITAISSRGRHNLAILGDRSVVAWGLNDFGQSEVPLEAGDARGIAAGTRHSLVLQQNEGFPEISSPALVAGVVSMPLSHPLAVANATVQSYSSMPLPVGLTLNPVTGVISGTLANIQRTGFRVFAHTDRGVLSQLVLLDIFDSNPPTDILLSAYEVMENAPPGMFVATISSVDPDEGSSHTYQLVSGTGSGDNSRFQISGDRLLVRTTIDIDFEKPHQPLSIRIRSRDSSGASFERALVLVLLDDRTEDADGDGLTEEEEEDIYGTSDTNFDSDGDGVGDGIEVQEGTSPSDPNDWPDYPVAAWGANQQGTIQPPFAGGIVAVSSGQAQGAALRNDGQILIWGGSNAFGQRNVPANAGDVVAIAAGGDGFRADGGHHLALRRDGTVIGWGYNGQGQASPPPGLNSVIQISAGRDHSLALRQDGTVVAWGANFYGQTNVPQGLADVVAISAGGFQCLALKRNGTVVGWGSFFNGAQWEPAFVPQGLVDVVAVAAGRFHCLALRRNGTVAAWGNGELGQTSVPAGLTGVTEVATGGFHSLALKDDGSVVGWGLNDHSQSTPPGPALHNVRLIGAGLQHSFVIRRNTEFPEITSSPEMITPVGGSFQFPVTVANAQTLAFSAVGLPVGISIHPQTGIISGTALAPLRSLFQIIVDTENGRLFQAASITATAGQAPLAIALSPAQVMENAPQGTIVGTFSAEDPDAGDTHTFQLVYGDGSADNPEFEIENGQLIVGPNFTRDFETHPAPLSIRVRVTDANLNHHEEIIGIEFLDDRTEDADGDGLTQAEEEDLYGTSDTNIDTDGDGFSDSFEIARGTSPTDKNDIPRRSMIIEWGNGPSAQSGTPISHEELLELDAGRAHSLALLLDGSVIAWGSNEFGQSDVPTDLAPAVNVAAGGRHSLSLDANGIVTAWGGNDGGQCDVPADLTEVIGISAGESHSLALKADGSVVAWGGNDFGQASVPNLPTSAIMVAAGGFHSLALLDDGTVAAWGSDWNGICTVPEGLGGVTAIAAGGYHSLALAGNGIVVAWGYNGHGQTLAPGNLGTVSAISAGWLHNLALKTDGKVIAWGHNPDGRTTIPLEAVAVRGIAAGGSHSLALRHDRPLAAISAASSVRASVGTLVEQLIIVDGAVPVDFRAVGMPSDLSLHSPTGLQAGLISQGEVRSVLLIATTDQGRLKRILPYNTRDGLPPTAIQLNPASVMGYAVAGTVVGTFTATDPDPGDTHSFSLVPGTGSGSNSQFLIEGNQLIVRTDIDVDFDKPHSNFSIRVRAVDAAYNEPYEQVITITLENDWSKDIDGNGLSEAVDAIVAWAGAAGLQGDDRLPGALPWGDGMTNLIKYAFGLNPSIPYQPPAADPRLPKLVLNPDGDGGTFEFYRRKNRGLVYQPMQSTSLDPESFSPLGGIPVVTRIDSTWERATYPFSSPPLSPRKQFFTVEVFVP